MRILHTVQHYPPYVGGMAEVVGRLSRELVKRGHEVTVATLFHPDRGRKVIDGVAIEEFHIEGNAVIGIRGEYRRYQEFLLRGEFEVIVNFAAPHWATDLMLPLLDNIKAVKVFVPTGFSTLFDPAYAPYFDLLAVLMKKYDMNVFTGREYRDFAFAQQVGVEKCRIIPNGAAAEEFLRQYDGDIRQQLGIPQTDELILHVGSFTGLKGQLEAIEIFRRTPLTHATLLLVGNDSHPEYYALCQETVARFMEESVRQEDGKRILIAALSREETVRAFQAAGLFLFPSKLECSPIVLFECMAAQTPFLTSEAGNAKEIIRWSGGGRLLPTYQDSAGFSHVMLLEGGHLLAELLQAKEQLAQMAKSGFAAWQKNFTWEQLAVQYETLYQELAAEKVETTAIHTKPLLTVAAMTVGDPVFALCEKAVQDQTLRNFCYKVIRNVSPISAACQQMIASADTPYLLQLDEDMILFPDALERMLAAIEAAPDEIGMICFHLWDEDRSMRIQGIKIWKTACLAQVVWQDTRASDVQVLEQIGRLGFRWVLHPDIVGKHGTLYTVDTIYRRYKSMYEKDIAEWNLVTGDLRAKAENFRRTGDVLELFALLGAVHGMAAAPYSENREKDFHGYQLIMLEALKKILLGPKRYAWLYEDGKPEQKPLTNPPLRLEEVQWQKTVSSRCIAEFNDTIRRNSIDRACYLWCDACGLTRFFQIATLVGVHLAGILWEAPDGLALEQKIAGVPLVNVSVLQKSATDSTMPFVIVSAVFCSSILAFLQDNGYQEGQDFVRNTLLP